MALHYTCVLTYIQITALLSQCRSCPHMLRGLLSLPWRSYWRSKSYSQLTVDLDCYQAQSF